MGEKRRKFFKFIGSERIFAELNKADSSIVIGVLDSSGSMGPHWGLLSQFWNENIENNPRIQTLAFSHKTFHIEGKVSSQIMDYGASTTNIIQALDNIVKIIKENPSYEDIFIIFVSDGEDSDRQFAKKLIKWKINNDLKKTVLANKNCCFISIGIGDDFPTFVAMDLRECFHTANPTIPPLFLIKEPKVTEYEEVFQDLDKYNKKISKDRKVNPGVWRFPWSTERTSSIFLNQWVITDENSLEINGEIFEVGEQDISIIELLDMTKGWLHILQLNSIHSSVKKEAKALMDLINSYHTAKKKNNDKLKSFSERMLERQNLNSVTHLNTLLHEVEKLAGEDILGKLSQVEAAKRLAIGTQIGKFHKRALNWKGFTVEEFKKAKLDFINLLETQTLNPESSQEPSIISLQNQKDVFLENDIKEGLKLCSSQYDLVEELPLVGQAIRIERTNESMINPWSVRIVDIARHHKVIDSKTIVSSKNTLVLSVGSNEKETINAVLPLFGEKDMDLKPFINSKIFHLMMTYNVIGNTDTLFYHAYPALLAKCLLFLMKQQASSWRDNLIDQITFTFYHFVMETSFEFKRYSAALLSNPRLAVVTSSLLIETSCEDLSKPFIILTSLVKYKTIEASKIEEILMAIIGEKIGREFFENEKEKISFYVKLDKINQAKEVYTKQAQELILNRQKDLTLYINFDKLEKALLTDLENIPAELDFNIAIELNDEPFFKKAKSVVALSLYIEYFENLLKKPIDKMLYIVWLINALQRNSYQRNIENLEFEMIIKKFIDKVLIDVKRNTCAHILNTKRENLKATYQDFYEKNKAIFDDKIKQRNEADLELLNQIYPCLRYLFGEL